MISGIHNLIDCSLIQQIKFETISNNLANGNTHAFKKDIVSFDQALASHYRSATDFSTGPIKQTGNALDVALGTDGFFSVETAGGIRYTRNGAFSMDAERYLVTSAGDRIMGQNGPIKIDGGDVAIDRQGQISVDNTLVDTFALVDFKDRSLLKKDGVSYYREDPDANAELFATDRVDVQQGYLESSNVSLTEEMIMMVEALRAFESAQKAIQSIDEITGKIVNDYGVLQ